LLLLECRIVPTQVTHGAVPLGVRKNDITENILVTFWHNGVLKLNDMFNVKNSAIIWKDPSKECLVEFLARRPHTKRMWLGQRGCQLDASSIGPAFLSRCQGKGNKQEDIDHDVTDLTILENQF
jgi:hypothetical protein